MEDSPQMDISSNQADMDVRSERRGATKKTNKPLIEKRRRARINECLQQLKEIIVKDRQLDNVRGNRLEKADILEMTVEYIRQLSNEGSPVSCLQTAYERGVERCVREMSEFMLSQRDVIDSSVTHKLTNHCRKMLGNHYPQADHVQSQLTGSKRAITTTTENMADSSTSPKLYRIDDDNESNVGIGGEEDLAGSDNHNLREAPQAGSLTPARSASTVPVGLHFNPMISSCTTSPFIQTAIPNSSNPNACLTINPEPVGSSNMEFPIDIDDYRDHVLTSSCKDSTETNPANPSIKHTNTSSQSFSPNIETETMPLSITSTSITPPLSNFISKPVFFSCPGNIFILVDKPAVLPQPQSLLPGSVIPVEQNVLTLLPTPMTYKLPASLAYTSVDRTGTEIGLPQAITSGNCEPPFSLQSMIPQNQTTVNNFTSGSENPVSILLNPGVLVKHEPANNLHLSRGQNPTAQYLLHSQDHQNDNRQVFQPCTNTFSHFQNTSGQIFQTSQGNNIQFFQNVQPVPSAAVQQHQTGKMMQKTSSPSTDNTTDGANAPAGFTFSPFNHASIIPGKKLPEDQHGLPERGQPEYRVLEHNPANTKLPEHILTDHKLPYNKLLGHKLPEPRLIENKEPKSVSPRGYKQPATISQTSKSSETPNGDFVVDSLSVSERCSPDFEDLPTDLRHAPPDDSCLFLSASSRLAAPGHNSSSSNEIFHSRMPCDERSSILNAGSSMRMDTATNEHARVTHSTSQSVNHTPDSSIEGCGLYNIPSPMSRAASRVHTSSNPDTHEMFSYLQERSEVLDLSWKVPVNSCCRHESIDVDINNNAVGSTNLYSGSNHIPPKCSLGVIMSNETNKMNFCISNVTISKSISNQAYTQQETVGSSPCSRSNPGLVGSSVWRPWGNNSEMKELH